MNGVSHQEVRRLLRNWRAENDSAALYSAFAALERAVDQRAVYAGLADAERRHAGFWEQRLRESGVPLPPFRPSVRTSVLITLARCCGVAFVVPSVISREMRDRDAYSDQEDARRAGLAHEEHGHAAALRGRDASALGNNLRAAVLGANDGLTSNFCLMLGVAGGGGSASSILLAGVAGLIAGASSMAFGEWLSVTNARELALSQLDREMDSRAPDTRHPSVAAAGDAASAAAFSFGSFAVGALLPLLPFLVLPVAWRIAGSVVMSLTALYLLGVATSLFNARSAAFSGVRQVVIGLGAAGTTYMVGLLCGAVLR